jgi:hypothetical protein
MVRYEYATTIGSVIWDGREVQHVDDPVHPEGDGWELCGSVLGCMRSSSEHIFWFWRKPVRSQSKAKKKGKCP